MTTSVPRAFRRCSSSSAVIRLADTRRYAEVDAMPPTRARAGLAADAVQHLFARHVWRDASACAIQCQVQLENVHAWLTEDARGYDPRCDRSTSARTWSVRHPARLSHAVDLKQRIGGTDVWIEAAGGSGYRVDWHGRIFCQSILRAVGDCAIRDGVDQLLVRRAQIRAA